VRARPVWNIGGGIMTSLESDQTLSKQSNWMIPVISDLIRFEYEVALKDNPKTRTIIEVIHRGFWGALLTHNPALARAHFTHMTKVFSAIGLDPMFAETIDTTIIDNLSEMILVRSKTQRTRSRIELKKLMQAAAIRGEIDGWWNAHH
jgi:hypothetical protein